MCVSIFDLRRFFLSFFHGEEQSYWFQWIVIYILERDFVVFPNKLSFLNYFSCCFANIRGLSSNGGSKKMNGTYFLICHKIWKEIYFIDLNMAATRMKHSK